MHMAMTEAGNVSDALTIETMEKALAMNAIGAGLRTECIKTKTATFAPE